MNEKQISTIIFERLEPYGAIKWHKNTNHSFYIKFKDVRLGSVRISNHNRREKYKYTYEIDVKEKGVEKHIEKIIESVKAKSKSIPNFDGKKYVVFNVDKRQYEQVQDYQEYQNIIKKRVFKL